MINSTWQEKHPERSGKDLVQCIHDPQLDTVLMVEKAIKDAGTYPTRKALWKSLPKQVQYQTFGTILEYLECSQKIIFDHRRIVWVFPDSPQLQRLLDTRVTI